MRCARPVTRRCPRTPRCVWRPGAPTAHAPPPPHARRMPPAVPRTQTGREYAGHPHVNASPPPPGWYLDPSGKQRYWTGTEWGPGQPVSKRSRVWLIIAAVIGFLIVFSVINRAVDKKETTAMPATATGGNHRALSVVVSPDG